ncbi:MAG: TonB-dependent receptor [Saprospiraceae bacterium]|nr:TonB-dependent receptor [Saprospiraceae bacterium]
MATSNLHFRDSFFHGCRALIATVLICFCFPKSSLQGQQLSTGTISGRVTLQNQTEFPLATVQLPDLSIGDLTNEKGEFKLSGIEPGTYQIHASYLGYETQIQEVTVKAQSDVEINFLLSEDVNQLNEVLVTAQSQSTELSQNPIQIASIDVVKLQSESADVVSVLDRTAGVRVRQSGGLGSNTSIQLNGLSGLAVRTYLDGIPLELYGGSVQLNNLPVNAVERVDVYKGVMPVDVGTDALAGGINVISRQVDYDYLDASYQFGSFNTHIGSLNASKKIGDHIVFSLSSFYNYSDNNYQIRANQRTPDFKEIEVEVERFHSAHQSSMVSGNLGLINIGWADKFSVGVSYNQRFDEIQHGVRIGNRAVGEASLRRNALIGNLQYRKRLLNNRLSIGYFGNFSIAEEMVRDSTTNVYDWFGNVFAQNSQGMEVLGRPSLRDGRTESVVNRLNISYAFDPLHELKLSSFLSNQRITGSDPLAIRIGDVDPNTVPSLLMRSITGLSYESKWFDAKLESILFGKFYYYDQSAADFRASVGNQVFEFASEGSEPGYGLGLKYTLKDNLFFRVSYEQAIRIPTKDEVFGNFLTIEPNFFLRPEKSKNLNVGAYYKHNFSPQQYISLDASWFLRDQSDLIRLEAGRNENDPAQFINEAEADATGIELTLNIAPLKDLQFSGSLTLQEVVKDGIPNATNTNGIGNPIPNIPSTFYNIAGRYKFASPFSKADEISVFGYYTFVNEFDLIFQTTRNEENIIPLQSQMDLGLTYKFGHSGLILSLQTNNLLDAEVFDNYRVPKPGRNFSIKLRYLIQRI